MKHLIKQPMKAFWRWTHPVRRPITRKVEAMISRACVVQLATHPAIASPASEETALLMDHMIRELIRLQTRVDTLQDAIADLAANSSTFNLTVVHDRDGDEPAARSAAG